MTQPIQIEEYTLASLEAVRVNREETIEEAKADLAMINAEINRRYIAQVQAAYRAADKETGTINLDLPDGWKLKADVKKSVKYDSAVLMGVASQIPWERAQKLFKVSVGMTESLYKALDAVDPDLKAKIDEGRTVTTSDPSIKIIPPA